MSEPSAESPRKTLGILIGVAPTESSFRYGVELGTTAQSNRIQVYLYLLDDAVMGIEDPGLSTLIDQGAKVMACAYGARKRDLPLTDTITFGGLGLLNNMIANTDRFVGFCH